jgi:hypothetical protein
MLNLALQNEKNRYKPSFAEYKPSFAESISQWLNLN